MNDNKEWIKLGFTDIDGVLRGKIVNRSKIEKRNTLGYCDVVFGWDLHDEVYPQDSVSGWQNGFPDAKATIDRSTQRIIPWDGMPFFIIDFAADEKMQNVCPRSLLKNLLEKFSARGYQVKVGFEYEWFNFKITDNTIDRLADHTITSGMFGYSLARLEQNHEIIINYLDSLKALDITLEGFHTETGPGVYEAAIKYDEALASADRATLFKHFTKAIFRQDGILASFMAKWNRGLPGCSGHTHVSIIKPDGQELAFSDMKQDSQAEGFLSGILDYMPAMMPLYGPTVNSYKRMVPGSWAPTTASWGTENRTTSVRVIPGTTDRIEVRIPASDSNPYLVLYAILSSGLQGIEEKKNLKQKKAVNNAYEDQGLPRLPASLGEACYKMRKEKSMWSWMNSKFLDHYLMTRELEYKKYHQAITDWEIKRYLEII